MMRNKNTIQDCVFSLDIGTRSVVGVVGRMERGELSVIAMAVKEHETRAMMDGQIHDIYKVGETIRIVKNQLEKQLDAELTDVCIAAAGRVLKTVRASAEYQFEEETRVISEHIYSLNLLAVEKAHMQLNSGGDGGSHFYCVGNTPVKYWLNDYEINNLEGHKANKIGVDLIATFLPDEVVDGLYEAVNYAGLQVLSLTLEPIAAINIAIPERYRLLNLALIDVGAGTSDICITKDGSIVAYGMIPSAGDEITEVIAKTYLVEFNTAEKIKIESNKNKKKITYKDIMGLPQTVTAEEVRKMTDTVVDKIAKEAADKIIEINGGKAANAVFIVGGGGKITGYTQKIAAYLKIDSERVAIRGEEVLTNIDFLTEDFQKDALYVTPVGICYNYFIQKSSFVFVMVNNERVKLYDNNHLSVADAVMQIDFPNEKLFPRRGKELRFTINKTGRTVRGAAGDGAVIKLNKKSANLNTAIGHNDIIEITESTAGEPAVLTIGELEEFDSVLEFQVNGKNIICPRFAYVNKELKSEYYAIQENDDIMMENYYTVSQLFEFLDFDISGLDVIVNNEPALPDTKVYANFSVRTAEKSDGLADSYQELYKGDSEPEEFDSEQERPKKNSQSRKAADEQEPKEQPEAPQFAEITIVVNGQPVKMTGKKGYIFVDLFEFYEFDLSKPQGSIVLKLNGEIGEHTAVLHDGDVVEIYWEK